MEEPERYRLGELTVGQLHQGNNTFVLIAETDSLAVLGVMSGDQILLEFTPPSHGDLVSAMVDGETIIRRYLSINGHPSLSIDTEPGIFAGDIVVHGVVRAVIRVFH